MRAYRPSLCPDVRDDRFDDARSHRQRNLEAYQRRAQEGLPLFSSREARAEGSRTSQEPTPV